MQKWTSRFHQGDHIIHIYRDDRELLRSLFDMIAMMGDDEKIVYLSDKDIEKHVSYADGEIGRVIKSALKNGKLSVMPSYETYCPTGEFLMESILKLLRELANKIDKEGCEGAIIAGDISWLPHYPSLFQPFLHYERAIDLCGVPKNIRIMCQYDSRLFNSQQLESAMNVHQLVLRGQTLERRNWIVVRKMDNSIFSFFDSKIGESAKSAPGSSTVARRK
ncbi:MAG: MEDS domain-containing protein [Methanomassiliicoccales archaeon]|nr:MEDS domain-containing protein [Methanomassiliicoccales archaeon]